MMRHSLFGSLTFTMINTMVLNVLHIMVTAQDMTKITAFVQIRPNTLFMDVVQVLHSSNLSCQKHRE